MMGARVEEKGHVSNWMGDRQTDRQTPRPTSPVGGRKPSGSRISLWVPPPEASTIFQLCHSRDPAFTTWAFGTHPSQYPSRSAQEAFSVGLNLAGPVSIACPTGAWLDFPLSPPCPCSHVVALVSRLSAFSSGRWSVCPEFQPPRDLAVSLLGWALPGGHRGSLHVHALSRSWEPRFSWGDGQGSLVSEQPRLCRGSGRGQEQQPQATAVPVAGEQQPACARRCPRHEGGAVPWQGPSGLGHPCCSLWALAPLVLGADGEREALGRARHLSRPRGAGVPGAPAGSGVAAARL